MARKTDNGRLLNAQVSARRADDDRIALPAALQQMGQGGVPVNRDVRRWRQRKAARVPR